MFDAYAECKAVCAVDPHDFATTVEGNLVALAGHRGRALLKVSILEDASQAATEKLDITVHAVASDSVTPAAGNQVAALDQIVGVNDGSAILREFTLAVPIEGITEPYLQVLLTETNTYECIISAEIIFLGDGYLPVNS